MFCCFASKVNLTEHKNVCIYFILWPLEGISIRFKHTKVKSWGLLSQKVPVKCLDSLN